MSITVGVAPTKQQLDKLLIPPRAALPESSSDPGKPASSFGVAGNVSARSERVAAPGKPLQSSGASWGTEYAWLGDEIHVRHYSPKTLKTYQGWVRQFQAFTKSRLPESLSTGDTKDLLMFLVVKPKVSATTQNQAFNHRTTMICTHTIKSTTFKEKKGPLDF